MRVGSSERGVSRRSGVLFVGRPSVPAKAAKGDGGWR